MLGGPHAQHLLRGAMALFPDHNHPHNLQHPHYPHSNFHVAPPFHAVNRPRLGSSINGTAAQLTRTAMVVGPACNLTKPHRLPDAPSRPSQSQCQSDTRSWCRSQQCAGTGDYANAVPRCKTAVPPENLNSIANPYVCLADCAGTSNFCAH
eukprot:SAG31_NODE_1230_length_9212_cov_3.669264_4_plen_151_part_00